MKTLLQKAKSYTVYRQFDKSVQEKSIDQYINLAIAYLKGDISYSQFGRVIGKRGSNNYNYAWVYIREAYKRGRIKIK